MPLRESRVCTPDAASSQMHAIRLQVPTHLAKRWHEAIDEAMNAQVGFRAWLARLVPNAAGSRCLVLSNPSVTLQSSHRQPTAADGHRIIQQLVLVANAAPE